MLAELTLAQIMTERYYDVRRYQANDLYQLHDLDASIVEETRKKQFSLLSLGTFRRWTAAKLRSLFPKGLKYFGVTNL